jgi:hypothetical protein
MNVASLQLEGLIMAVASINQVLVRKRLLTMEEVDRALRKVEAAMIDDSRLEELSPAHRDAVNFPLRALQITNNCPPEADIPSFADVARMVGEMKPAYNDQR